MDKAVILAAGLGTRMQKCDDSAHLNADQADIAASGVKAMIPIGRPFLDYIISALADAGYRRICLVIGPAHQSIRQYYESLDCSRVTIEFAIQAKPLGTADAVASAKEFAGTDDFCVINSDTYYPVKALKALRQLDSPGLIGFQRNTLIAGSNIEPERIAKFAVMQTDSNGDLTKIIEKPSEEILVSLGENASVSLNCWRFNARIFEACKAIKPSPRGELELPDAVEYAMNILGQKFRVIPIAAGVLDMSSRKDIESVKKRLANVEVSL